MRRKQLFVMLLAGALTVGAVPYRAAGAEDFGAVSAEEGLSADTAVSAAGASEETGEVPQGSAETSEIQGTLSETPEGGEPAQTTEVPDAPLPDTPAETPPQGSEGTPSETPVPDTPSETPSETPVPDTPSETPSETPSVIPVPETPSETPAPETPSETPVPDATVPEVPGDILSEGTVTGTPSPAPEQGTGVTYDSHNYATLAEAVAAVTAGTEPAQIKVNGDLELSESVLIDGGKSIMIVAAAENVKIKRAAGFTDSLFKVSSGTLAITGGTILEEDASSVSGTITVDGSLEEADGTVTGSLVDVTGGTFLLGSGAVLTGNQTSAAGSAVSYDESSTVSLTGGTITGNSTSAEGGAVYGSGKLEVSGTLSVTENKKVTEEGETQANIVLPAGSSLTVSGTLTEASIGLKILEAKAGDSAVTIGTDGDGQPVTTMADILPQITYDDPLLDLGEDGALKEAEATEPSETPVPSPGVTGTPAPEVTGTPVPSGTPSVPAGEAAIDVRSREWTSADSLEMYFTFNKNGRYYIKVLNAKTATPEFSAEELAQNGKDAVQGQENYFSENFSKTLEQSRKVVVCVYFQPADGGEVLVERYKMDEEIRPARLTGVSASRTSASEARCVFRANKGGTFYVQWAPQSDDAKPNITCEGEGTAVAANTDQPFVLNTITESGPISIWVRMKDSSGILSGYLQFNLDAAAEATVTPTPSRDPIVPAVTASRVTGLENPLEFYPNTFYDFTVIGAGSDTQPPYVKGDVQWKPLYWSTSTNPDPSNSGQAHRTWRIGSAAGITTAATYNLYVFFQRVEYDGTQWVEQDTVERVTYQFRSADISNRITNAPYPTATPSGGGYYDQYGTYHYYDETDPEYQTADGTVTGAETSATPPKTSDDAPVGHFLALAFASVLAGSTVLVRKRKKEVR